MRALAGARRQRTSRQLPEDGIDLFAAKMLALALVGLGVLFTAAQGGPGEIHVHHLTGPAGLGRNPGRAGVTEEIQDTRFLAVVTKITPGATQIQEEVRVLTAMMGVHLEGLAHFLDPDRIGSMFRVEQLRGLTAAALPHHQLRDSQLLLTPALEHVPVQVEHQRAEQLQQCQRPVAVQSQTGNPLAGTVENSETIGLLLTPADGIRLAPLPGLFEQVENAQGCSPTKLPLATFFFFAKASA